MILLRNFINQNNIVLNIEGSDQSTVLKALMQPMINSNVLTNADLFLEDLLSREQQVSTVMENCTAFPHARTSAVSRMCVSVGIAQGEGIQYCNDTNRMSKLFFLIGVPSFAPTAHLPLLKMLAKFTLDTARMEKLINVSTTGTASKILANYKGK